MSVAFQNLEYHDKIKCPMSFDMIRQKLASTLPDRYRDIKEVVDDIRLVFKNAYTFNPVGLMQIPYRATDLFVVSQMFVIRNLCQ